MFSLGMARVFAAKLEASAQADFKDLQKNVLNYSRRKKYIRDIGFKKVLSTLAEVLSHPTPPCSYNPLQPTLLTVSINSSS